MGSILGPYCHNAKDVNQLLLSRMCDINSISRPLYKTSVTQYHVPLGLPDKGCAIKRFVVY